MLSEALLVRPVTGDVSLDMSMSCQMTRSELQRKLNECAYGRNRVIFDVYFRWSEGTGGQPYCNVCFRPIGVHGDGALPEAALPTVVQPAPPPPPPRPPSPAPPPPRATVTITNGMMIISAPAPPSSLHQPAPLSSAYQPQSFPDASTLYAPRPQSAEVVAAQRVLNAPMNIPLLVPRDSLPSKLTAATSHSDRAGSGEAPPDVVSEWYNLVLLSFVAISTAFSILFFAVALLVGASDDNHSVGDNPLLLVFAAWWLLCAIFFAYDCKRFECQIYRGVRVVSVERRLLTALCLHTESTIEWSAIARGDADVEVVESTPMSFCLFGICCGNFCSLPRWAVIVMREKRAIKQMGYHSTDDDDDDGNKNLKVVQLARCPPGVVDEELRLWSGYISAVNRTAVAHLINVRRAAIVMGAEDEDL